MAATLTVSYSELDTARQCLHKHELAYRDRWTRPTTAQALSRGILWHTLLEGHYKAIKQKQIDPSFDLTDTLRKLVGELLYQDDLTQTDDQELIEWMYTGYVERWGFDEQWEIIAVEHAPEVWLPTPRGGRSRFKLKMKIDLIVRERDTDHVLVVDHKSGKNLPTQKELDLDDQFGLYTWAMRHLGWPIFGSTYSAARTQRNKNQERFPQPLDERFTRTSLYRTDEELDTIAVEAYKWARLAYQHKPGEAPRSPNPDTCRWRCDFTEACLLGRKGIDEVEVLLGSGYSQNFQRH